METKNTFNKEEVISEQYEWQIEEKINGLWYMIFSTDDKTTLDELLTKYEKWKQSHSDSQYRLIRWSKIVKYEVMEGEGF